MKLKINNTKDCFRYRNKNEGTVPLYIRENNLIIDIIY